MDCNSEHGEVVWVMATATVTTLATSLGLTPSDSTALDSIQEDILYELARLRRLGVVLQTKAEFIAVTADTVAYSYPTGARSPLMIIFDDAELALASRDEAQLFDDAWRARPSDRPLAATFDSEDRDSFGLVPPARRAGSTITAETPYTFTAWPSGNLTLIHARTDLTYAGTSVVDTHLAMVFDMLARDFGRDSIHADATAAQAATQMADFFWQLSFPEVSPLG
jgi:hypothetical protein